MRELQLSMLLFFVASPCYFLLYYFLVVVLLLFLVGLCVSFLLVLVSRLQDEDFTYYLFISVTVSNCSDVNSSIAREILKSQSEYHRFSMVDRNVSHSYQFMNVYSSHSQNSVHLQIVNCKLNVFNFQFIRIEIDKRRYFCFSNAEVSVSQVSHEIVRLSELNRMCDITL